MNSFIYDGILNQLAWISCFDWKLKANTKMTIVFIKGHNKLVKSEFASKTDRIFFATIEATEYAKQ